MDEKKPAPMRHCFFCGEELGRYRDYDDGLVTCGKQECEREARAQIDDERFEAHQQLDEDRGWGRW